MDNTTNIGQPIGQSHLLNTGDVAAVMGCSRDTAIKLMKESGKIKRIHSRLYIFADDLEKYIKEAI